MPSRLLTTLYAATLGYCIARACGVPIWTSFNAGDASDIGLLTGCVVYNLLGFAIQGRAAGGGDNG